MVTKKQFLRQIDKVNALNNKLNGSLEILGNMASEVLGGDYCADLCSGIEIEFRPKIDNDVYDYGIGMFKHNTLFLEDVLDMLEK